MHTARLEAVRAKCQLPPPVEVARRMMYFMLPTPLPPPFVDRQTLVKTGADPGGPPYGQILRPQLSF